jgi:hypothetical protein
MLLTAAMTSVLRSAREALHTTVLNTTSASSRDRESAVDSSLEKKPGSAIMYLGGI